MFNEISDTRLQAMLKRHLSAKYMQDPKLKNLRLCGSQVTRQMGALPAVFVVTNTEKSRFFGVNTCHSIWACPRCTAKAMAAKGREIASAIDALQKWYNEVAFMVTFTLPHTATMTCSETYEILAKTWRFFSKGKGTNKKQYQRKRDNKQVEYTVAQSPFASFFKVGLGGKHYIRIYEFTHGKNSWHPHIHALFWIPRRKIFDVVGYEDSLNEYWWKCAKRAALEVLKKTRPTIDVKAFVNELYADWRKTPKTGHRSVFISKDERGVARIQESSYYISGWSGDYELTADMKHARTPGHMTPFQMLETAYKTTDENERQRLLELFTEYATAVHHRRRTFWSARTGIVDIIRRWEQSNDYVESLKKKFTDKAIDNERWKVVCWFSVEQWSSICYRELTDDADIKAKILALARLPDGKQQIESLLFENDIDITKNGRHHLTDHIENKVFENVYAELVA